MLTDRLNMIISHTNGGVIADVGTDHAYIPVKLITENLAEHVIATDVRKGPLDSARRNVIKNDCGDKIELRLGSGLSPLKAGECGTIIIAGMGGELICSILKDGDAVARTAELLLLQPMNSQDMLREYLSSNGYEILEEDIEREGFKVYNLIIARSGKMPEFKDEFELHLPPYLYGHRHFPALLAKKKREFDKILCGLKNAKVKNDAEIARFEGLLKRVCELEDRL